MVLGSGGRALREWRGGARGEEGGDGVNVGRQISLDFVYIK